MLHGWAGSVLRSISRHRRIASLTSSTSQSASGTSSTTTSRGLSTHSRKRLLQLMWLSSLWQDLRGQELGRAVRGTDEVLTPSIGLAKEKGMVSRGPPSSRQLTAGIAGSMATDPLSAAVAGLGDKIGVHLDPIQAAREGRPNGDVGIGDGAIRAKVGEMIGGDRQHPAPLLRRPSLHDLHQRLHQCLTLRPTRHQILQQKPLAQQRRRRGLSRYHACHLWSAKSTARSMACRTSSAPIMMAR